ncbi:hypothetical protein [Methylocystis echinoides]|uniref:Uncharacterized protein n=1 Tax=Methylocystis echinoides TaxID=29468 RepID=A0A9W6LUJ2_9HYPH|nr:hypothetical protein [Methylocystis echinoides]GLI95586.1 hypothetical protein LMG27198_45780 [Methylocystis echinoides]
MDASSPINPANILVVKIAQAPPADPWLWRELSTIDRERSEEILAPRQQNTTRGLRLINLERRARFSEVTF